MNEQSGKAFDDALYGISENIAKVLFLLPTHIKEKTQEIRLRLGKEVALTVGGRTFFVMPDSTVSSFPQGGIKAEKKDLEDSFRQLCRSSVYSHINQIKNGYIMMRGGMRAGVCGTFSPEAGLTHISSVNIRIARQIFGVADSLIQDYRGGGVLIAGPPGSGKTTLLRDFIRQLSNGAKGEFYRVCVIDSRGEISASFEGVCHNDLGVNTDILSGFEKSLGTEIAIRTLYPHFVAFDEIGSKAELQGVADCICAGVDIITTAHIGNIEELMKREITRLLLQSSAIKNVVILKNPAGSQGLVLTAEEVTKNCG